MNLTKRHVEMRLVQRVSMAAVCAAMVLATCATAMALRVEVGPQVEAVAVASGGAGAVKVEPDQLKSTYKKPPVYPLEAKQKKDTLNGPVVLAVIISKDGAVQQIRVKKSLRADYDRSALEAVKDWKWEPYLLNGEPTEVETTVTVNYSLAPESEEKPQTQADASGAINSPPKVIAQVAAEYPEEAKISKDTLNGVVIVSVTVGADGAVKEAHIEQSLRADYDENALKAVRRYRFAPALADGRPVEEKIQIEIDFRTY